MTDLLLTGVRVWSNGDAACDLAIADGRIAAIGPGLSTDAPEVFDGRGCLVIPGLVDAHAHVDKTLWGTPWHPHQAGPSVLDKIENERRVLKTLGLSPEVQSARLLRHMVARGTTHVRTHVDIGPDVGLAHFHGVQAMRDSHRDWIDVEIVAFPQTGVMIRPGTLELLEQAVREGAEAVGGIDPVGIDRDPKGQLDGLFAIAERHGCGIDIHLHDRGDMGAVTIDMIVERTRALGLAGKVAISHAFCLGMLEPARLDGLIEALLELDIAIMTHAPSGPTPFPPIRLLHDRGVRLFSGSDGVRDTWGPLNTGDMLERAFLLAYRSGFRDDPSIEIALRMATYGGAAIMGAEGYGLTVGSAADLVLVEAETAAEAVAFHPPRRLVVKRGRVVARDGRSLLPPAA
ncbi:cytosine deaminase [Thalassobaculum fulvum]|uniref:Cytosine deaminase n=1 Tax=Thalassobaculum fulvum TaxID=1633335 RepID=A0A918XRZ0_9PROT|nr:amidohydrolase family protein [Thalassobaculum fulvum]GHD50097.1 cytosine deaminase [Thalassobaculum fulvum]